jgi:RHS repeat-associated protein
VEVTDSVSGTLSYAYDSFNRLTSKTTPQGSISYTYDAAGRRTSMTVAGQSSVNYTYDTTNRLTQVTQGSNNISFNYDNASRVTSISGSNGILVEYTYDLASNLTGIVFKKDAVVLGDLTYQYNAEGKRTKMGGSFARTGLPQPLTSVNHNAANQLTQRGAAVLAYDNNGNLTSDGTNTYTWNARNQLAGMSGPGLTASFQYDVSGRRTNKTINGVSTSYLYDGDSAVQELSGTTPSANLVTGGVDKIFTRTDATGTRTPLTDAQGSTLALVDDTGTMQTQYTYDPFGNTTTTGQSNANSSKYTGREDDGTGLYYYRARYYSPSLQRFISEDPIRISGGDTNLYAYVGNDPINFVDPSGLCGVFSFVPQNSYDPRVDFRDYALQLSTNGQPNDCLKLALLAFKAGQVFGADAIGGLLRGLTERAGLTGDSDPNFRVGVFRRDPFFGNGFGDTGFLPMFQDNSNQVRHFVGWFAAGAYLGPRYARRRLYQEEGTSSMNNPDVALGMLAINMGWEFSKSGDHRALAQAIWRDVCGGQGQLQLP